MKKPRTNQFLEQQAEQSALSDTPQARHQPQDPEQENWGDEMDDGGEMGGLSDYEVDQIRRGN